MPRKHLILVAIVLALAAPSLQAQINVLHSFGTVSSDGANPTGSLILQGSTLYGMTQFGGISNHGTIFRIDVRGSKFAALHRFTGADGSRPLGSLLLYNSVLYGMTSAGGASGKGTIFRVNLNGTGFAVIHSFAGGAQDGDYPMGSLIRLGGSLFGMTMWGGSANYGTIFRIKLDGTGLKILHSFGPEWDGSWLDGSYPDGNLKYVGTRLYGMTCDGGEYHLGTVFGINPDGTGYAVLHSFAGGASDGATPNFSSLAVRNSVLYGMTYEGGSSNLGSIFRINPNGSRFSLLHSFTTEASGAVCPWGTLATGGGKLYGTTSEGGPDGRGVIFEINPDGSGFDIVHSFFAGPTDGGDPCGSLIRKLFIAHGDEMLYGMAYYGGAADQGVIFSYKLK